MKEQRGRGAGKPPLESIAMVILAIVAVALLFGFGWAIWGWVRGG